MASAATGALGIFGDQIESLREFDIDSQTSVRDLRSADILLGAADDQGGHRPRLHRTAIISRSTSNRTERSSANIQISEGWIELGPEDFSGAFQDCEIGEFAIGDLMLHGSKTRTVCRALKGMAHEQGEDRHLFSDRGRDRALSRDHRTRRMRLTMSILLKGLSPADFVFRRPISSCFRPRNYSDDSPHIGRRRLRRAERHRAPDRFQ